MFRKSFNNPPQQDQNHNHNTQPKTKHLAKPTFLDTKLTPQKIAPPSFLPLLACAIRFVACLGVFRNSVLVGERPCQGGLV